MTKIFCVDTDKEYNIKDVRDAMVECFVRFHNDYVMDKDETLDLISDQIDLNQVKEFKEDYIKELVRKFFKDVDVDFDNPDREGIIKVLDRMRDFSVKYRDRKIIEDNYSAIKKLLDGAK